MSRDPVWVRNIMYRARASKDETYLAKQLTCAVITPSNHPSAEKSLPREYEVKWAATPDERTALTSAARRRTSIVSSMQQTPQRIASPMQ